MDATALDRDVLAAALEQVARANFMLGGLRSLLRHLRPLVRGLNELQMLDVGVGNGRLSSRVARELGRDGVDVRWTGIDHHADVLAVARRELTGAPRGSGGGLTGARDIPLEPDVRTPSLIRADAEDLPFSDDSFDVAAATLTLHHLSDPACEAVLAEMARVSRIAVLVSDLERSRLHYLGARLLSATVWRRDPLTRYDAPLSVRRSFTRPELEELAARAPFRSAVVKRHFPFRLLLEGRP
ncbi:MAG: methyltransferase domain-containing protein [Gemmatimonadota bacterium]